MPKKLIDNQSSDFIEAYRGLLSKNAQTKIYAYVESHEDIAFWHHILKDYETPKVRFDIQLPSQTNLSKGKEQALEKRHELLNMGIGKYLIICIDSDYDYLLQNKTAESQLINQSPFIFQTYTYSIENMRCFSSCLDHICVQAIHKPNNKIDFEELLKLYSTIIYPLFIWSVFLRINNFTAKMNLDNFSKTIKIRGRVNIHQQGLKHLEDIQKEVTEKLASLETIHPTELENLTILTKELSDLGLKENNTYLFIHGHTLENEFILPFLNSLCQSLKSEVETQIMNTAKHQIEKDDELNHYRNKITPVETILKSNTEYKDCFLFQKIKTDLDFYISQIELP